MAQRPFQTGAIVNLSGGESSKEVVICTPLFRCSRDDRIENRYLPNCTIWDCGHSRARIPSAVFRKPGSHSLCRSRVRPHFHGCAQGHHR
jgi:hypothetical protein